MQIIDVERKSARSRSILLWGAVLISVVLVGAACSRKESASKVESLRQGDEFFAARKFAQAVSAYQKAVAADPRDGRSRAKLADAYAAVGQWNRAATESIRASDLLPADHDAQLAAIRMMLLQGRFLDVSDKASQLLRT